MQETLKNRIFDKLMVRVIFVFRFSRKSDNGFGDGNPFCGRYPIFGDIDPLLVINILFFLKNSDV